MLEEVSVENMFEVLEDEKLVEEEVEKGTDGGERRIGSDSGGG